MFDTIYTYISVQFFEIKSKKCIQKLGLLR